MTAGIAEIKSLSVAERIELIEAIWDSIAANPNEMPLMEAQKIEIDRRLADYRKNP